MAIPAQQIPSNLISMTQITLNPHDIKKAQAFYSLPTNGSIIMAMILLSLKHLKPEIDKISGEISIEATEVDLEELEKDEISESQKQKTEQLKKENPGVAFFATGVRINSKRIPIQLSTKILDEMFDKASLEELFLAAKIGAMLLAEGVPDAE